MPDEVEITNMFDVSRNTLQKAFDDRVNKGYFKTHFPMQVQYTACPYTVCGIFLLGIDIITGLNVLKIC